MEQNKPTVQIKDCYIFENYLGINILSGITVDYPDEHKAYPGCLSNGERVYTSAVVAVDGDTVETLRTIYKVQNWINNE